MLPLAQASTRATGEPKLDRDFGDDLAAADEGVGCGDAYAFDGIAVLLFLKRGR